MSDDESFLDAPEETGTAAAVASKKDKPKLDLLFSDLPSVPGNFAKILKMAFCDTFGDCQFGYIQFNRRTSQAVVPIMDRDVYESALNQGFFMVEDHLVFIAMNEGGISDQQNDSPSPMPGSSSQDPSLLPPQPSAPECPFALLLDAPCDLSDAIARSIEAQMGTSEFQIEHPFLITSNRNMCSELVGKPLMARGRKVTFSLVPLIKMSGIPNQRSTQDLRSTLEDIFGPLVLISRVPDLDQAGTDVVFLGIVDREGHENAKSIGGMTLWSSDVKIFITEVLPPLPLRAPPAPRVDSSAGSSSIAQPNISAPSRASAPPVLSNPRGVQSSSQQKVDLPQFSPRPPPVSQDGGALASVRRPSAYGGGGGGGSSSSGGKFSPLDSGIQQISLAGSRMQSSPTISLVRSFPAPPVLVPKFSQQLSRLGLRISAPFVVNGPRMVVSLLSHSAVNVEPLTAMFLSNFSLGIQFIDSLCSRFEERLAAGVHNNQVHFLGAADDIQSARQLLDQFLSKYLLLDTPALKYLNENLSSDLHKLRCDLGVKLEHKPSWVLALVNSGDEQIGSISEFSAQISDLISDRVCKEISFFKKSALKKMPDLVYFATLKRFVESQQKSPDWSELDVAVDFALLKEKRRKEKESISEFSEFSDAWLELVKKRCPGHMIRVFGPPEDVDRACHLINKILHSAQEAEVTFDCDRPKELARVIKDNRHPIQRQEIVSIKEYEETSSAKIFGFSPESISAARDSLNALFNAHFPSSSRVISTRIESSSEKIEFLKRYEKSQIEELCAIDSVECTFSRKGITLSGPKSGVENCKAYVERRLSALIKKACELRSLSQMSQLFKMMADKIRERFQDSPILVLFEEPNKTKKSSGKKKTFGGGGSSPFDSDISESDSDTDSVSSTFTGSSSASAKRPENFEQAIILVSNNKFLIERASDMVIQPLTASMKFSPKENKILQDLIKSKELDLQALSREHGVVVRVMPQQCAMHIGALSDGNLQTVKTHIRQCLDMKSRCTQTIPLDPLSAGIIKKALKKFHGPKIARILSEGKCSSDESDPNAYTVQGPRQACEDATKQISQLVEETTILPLDDMKIPPNCFGVFRTALSREIKKISEAILEFGSIEGQGDARRLCVIPADSEPHEVANLAVQIATMGPARVKDKIISKADEYLKSTQIKSLKLESKPFMTLQKHIAAHNVIKETREKWNVNLVLDVAQETVLICAATAEDADAVEETLQSVIDSTVPTSDKISCDQFILSLINRSFTSQFSEIQGDHSDVKITQQLGQNSITLKGPLRTLAVAKASVTKLIDAVTKLIIKKSFQVKNLELVSVLMSSSRCAFHADLQVLSEKHCVKVKKPDDQHLSKGSGSGESSGAPGARTVLCVHKISPSGHVIQLVQGNICKESADVIVNAANKDLKHSGGIAGAIVTAGGDTIIRASEEYIRVNSKLPPGDAWMSPVAGRLPCKQLIHAVGPIYRDGRSGESALLHSAVQKSLSAAALAGFSSIAIPALSSGIFRYPVSDCAQVILDAVQSWITANPSWGLKDIRIVILDQPTCQTFTTKFVENFGPSSKKADAAQSSPLPSTVVASAPASTRTDDEYETQVAWMWQEDNEQFVSYSKIGAETLEKDYQNYKKGLLDGRRSENLLADSPRYKEGMFYYVTFEDRLSDDGTTLEHTQHNTKTSFKRHVKRTETRVPKPKAPAPKVAAVAKPITAEVVIEGMDNDIQNAFKELSTLLRQHVKTDTIESTFTSSQKDSFRDVCTQLFVVTSFAPKTVSTETLTLQGCEEFVTQAKVKILERIAEDRDQAVSVRFPPEWIAQSENFVKVAISNGSTEWTKVEKRFVETMDQSKIVKIERIQNKFLWERYALEKQRMTKRLGSFDDTIHERLLFHGCGKTNPEDIYNGEEGFDMKFCKRGMWGIGSYFAQNAAYSHTYSSTLSTTGQNQFFLASVLTGDAHTCPPDSSLRMPPEKPVSSTLGFSKTRFDCVSGNTNGSDVFIIYDNHKAYPKYIITYSP